MMLVREEKFSDIPSGTKPVKHGWQSDHVHDGRMHLQKKKIHENFSFFSGRWRGIYDCAHACITNKMKLAEDVTDLVTG